MLANKWLLKDGDMKIHVRNYKLEVDGLLPSLFM